MKANFLIAILMTSLSLIEVHADDPGRDRRGGGSGTVSNGGGGQRGGGGTVTRPRGSGNTVSRGSRTGNTGGGSVRTQPNRGNSGRVTTRPNRGNNGRDVTAPNRGNNGRVVTRPNRGNNGRVDTRPNRGNNGRVDTRPNRGNNGRVDTRPNRGNNGRVDTRPNRGNNGRVVTRPNRGNNGRVVTRPNRGNNGRTVTRDGRRINPNTGRAVGYRHTTSRANYGTRNYHRPSNYVYRPYRSYRHAPYRTNYVHATRYTRHSYFNHLRLQLTSGIYFNWVLPSTTRLNGYYTVNNYPYMVFNGYRHRYSSYDSCNYQLVDKYTEQVVSSWWDRTCNYGYDSCAIERDNRNQSAWENRYYCAETFRDQSYNYSRPAHEYSENDYEGCYDYDESTNTCYDEE